MKEYATMNTKTLTIDSNIKLNTLRGKLQNHAGKNIQLKLSNQMSGIKEIMETLKKINTALFGTKKGQKVNVLKIEIPELSQNKSKKLPHIISNSGLSIQGLINMEQLAA